MKSSVVRLHIDTAAAGCYVMVDRKVWLPCADLRLLEPFSRSCGSCHAPITLNQPANAKRDIQIPQPPAPQNLH
eukprot:1985475-Amphidinium_carterae.1